MTDVERRLARVDRFNAFRVNRVGLQGPGFPLSIEVARRGAVWTVHGTALRAVDISAVMARHMGPVAVVFNIGHNWFDGGWGLVGAGEIAKRQAIAADTYDMTWAALAPRSTATELLVMASSDVDRFFEGWSLYDVDLLDLSARPSRDELDVIVLSVNTRKTADPPVLTMVEAASIYYGGHDDCYFYVESRTDGVPEAIMCHLLAMLAGSALLEEDQPKDGASDQPADVYEPHAAVAAELLSRSNAWVGVATVRDSGGVEIELTPSGWRLDQAIPHSPTHAAVFDPASGDWTVAAMSI